MRIPGYTRISSNSPEQLKALEQHKARLKAAGCTEIHWDIASRSRDDREGLNTVLSLIERQECDEAVFIRIDRMTDSPTVLEKAITTCLKADIPIRGLDDSIDFTTVGGRLHARLLCNLARAEVERLAERVQHGHEHHRKMNAAYFPPFGYKKVGQRLELDHEPFVCLLDSKEELSQAAIGFELVEIYLKTRSIRATLRFFNEKYGLHTFSGKGRKQRRQPKCLGFSMSGLTAWLNNPILRGHTAYRRAYKQRNSHKHLWDIRYDTHPEHRLMSEEEYKAIDSTLDWNAKHRSWQPPSTYQVHPLSGLVRCAECRGYCKTIRFQLRTNPSVKKHNYQCSNYQTKSCTQKRSLRDEVIEQSVIEALVKRAETLTAIAELPPDNVDPPELRELKAELSFYENAPGSRAAGIIAELRHQVEDFQSRQREGNHQQSAQRELLIQAFGDLTYWKTLLSEERRDLYRALVDQVMLRAGQVESVLLKV
ncbi:MAG: fdxN element excision recombinase XisF [Nodosilinea sp.]